MENKEPIIVSVCCTTFNHAKFIEKALDSFLMQKTNFKVEILLGEDESVDGTREICQAYVEKYPQRIKLFLGRREDVKILFGKPVGQNNLQRLLREVRGKYLAICEGDDYWTDPLKLQKQVDFLEKNLNVGACFHDVINIDSKGVVTNKNYFKPKQKSYTQEDCLVKLNSSYATCSIVARSDVFMEEWPNWFKQRTCDAFIDLMVTRNGRSLNYIPANMGAYRIHSGGVWQGADPVSNLKDSIYRLELLYKDAFFGKNYRNHLIYRLNKLIYRILFCKDIGTLQSLKYYFKLVHYKKVNSFFSLFSLIDALFISIFKKSLINIWQKIISLLNFKN